MDDNKLNQYADKKAYNNLPVPEGQYLAPFLVEDWDTVKAMNLYRDNLETWHFSGIPVLVAFTPVTAEQFPGTMKFFWSSVRTHIAELHGESFPAISPTYTLSPLISINTDNLLIFCYPLLSTNKSIPKIFINRIVFSISAVGFPRSKSEINVTESPVNSDT